MSSSSAANANAPARELGGDGVQSAEQLERLGVGDDPAAREHLRVGSRLRHIDWPEPPVKAKRRVDRLEVRLLWLGEPGHREG